MNDIGAGARDYVASLTGLRGIAALLVFLFHYDHLNPGIRLDQQVPLVGWLLQLPLGLGWAGVDIFFVLSGFLLTLPFAHARLQESPSPALGRYYKRRILRVFPAYYAQLAIITLSGAWFLTWRQFDIGDWLAHLVMAFNLGPEPVRPLVGVWWTLPVEFSFYLLLPVLALWMHPQRWPWVLGASIAFSVAWRYWTAHALNGGELFLVASHLPGSLPEFSFGASAAMLALWLERTPKYRPPAWALDLMFLSGITAAGLWLGSVVLPHGAEYWSGHWSMLLTPTILGLSLGLAILGIYRGSRLGQVLLANPIVHFSGLVSYSLYLWHFVVMQQAPLLFGPAWNELPGMPRFLASLGLVTTAAIASYFLFERPFFRLRGKRSGTGAAPR